MDKIEIKVAKEVISKIEQINFVQKNYMFLNFIGTYLISLINYGNNYITKDSYNIYKQFRLIQKEEQKIHKFILKNSKNITFEKFSELIELLEQLNEETMIYYINALNDIITACQTKNELYAAHEKKNFDTLIDTDEYRIQVSGLTITKEEIKEFLNYPQEFWKYVETKIKRIDGSKKENEIFYVTLMKFDEDNKLLSDIKVLIPYVTDIKTAQVNVHELKHAYDLYQRLGQEIDENNPEYEESAISLEQEFRKKYVLKKFKDKSK